MGGLRRRVHTEEACAADGRRKAFVWRRPTCVGDLTSYDATPKEKRNEAMVLVIESRSGVVCSVLLNSNDC